jgi:hypothetical protein
MISLKKPLGCRSRSNVPVCLPLVLAEVDRRVDRDLAVTAGEPQVGGALVLDEREVHFPGTPRNPCSRHGTSCRRQSGPRRSSGWNAPVGATSSRCGCPPRNRTPRRSAVRSQSACRSSSHAECLGSVRSHRRRVIVRRFEAEGTGEAMGGTSRSPTSQPRQRLLRAGVVGSGRRPNAETGWRRSCRWAVGFRPQVSPVR